MSPEAQRIARSEDRNNALRCAIAESRGWTPYSPQKNPKFWFRPGREKWKELCFTQEIPDYLTDLNAICAAVDELTPQQLRKYSEELSRAVGLHDGQEPWEQMIAIAQASCGERCEAYVRTVHRWTEGAQ